MLIVDRSRHYIPIIPPVKFFLLLMRMSFLPFKCAIQVNVLFSLNFNLNTHLEVMAPVIFASQQQFGFSHIAAGSTAFGKVKNGSILVKKQVLVPYVIHKKTDERIKLNTSMGFVWLRPASNCTVHFVTCCIGK